MNYKKLMGYGDKKKVTKKELKPKVNKVLENIKEEFGYKQNLKEVGNAQVHKKMIKKIEDGEGYFRASVQNYIDFLKEQGHTKEAQELSSKYTNFIKTFLGWLKTKWVRIIRKLI